MTAARVENREKAWAVINACEYTPDVMNVGIFNLDELENAIVTALDAKDSEREKAVERSCEVVVDLLGSISPLGAAEQRDHKEALAWLAEAMRRHNA